MLRTTIKTFVIAGLCFAGIRNSSVLAQDEGPVAGESSSIMGIQMSVDNDSGAGPVVISSSQMMFAGEGPGGESSFEILSGDSFGGNFMRGGSGSVNPLSLLDNTGIREELEMVGDQLDKFRNAQKEFRNQAAERAKSLSSGNLNPGDIGNIAKEIAELQKNQQKQLESMLMPHQLERLKQIALQVQMKKRGAAKTLLSDSVTEQLGIDDAQKKRIEDRQEELKKELAERMEKLKEEIRNKLLAELTSEQKAKLKELSGDDFDYKPTSMQNRLRKAIDSAKKLKP